MYKTVLHSHRSESNKDYQKYKYTSYILIINIMQNRYEISQRYQTVLQIVDIHITK